MDDICWPSIQNILNLEGENIARYLGREGWRIAEWPCRMMVVEDKNG